MAFARKRHFSLTLCFDASLRFLPIPSHRKTLLRIVDAGLRRDDERLGRRTQAIMAIPRDTGFLWVDGDAAAERPESGSTSYRLRGVQGRLIRTLGESIVR